MKTAGFYSYFLCGLMFIILPVSCRKDPSPFEVRNLNNNTISAFGHAGMGITFKYPTNSYESLEACLRIGADGTEMDVQLTRDSVLVLYHDAALETSTSLHGIVNELSWQELQHCVYASPFSSDIRLQKAEDILTEFRNSARIFTFDCKLYNRSSLDYNVYIHTYVRALLALIQKHELKNLAFVESGDAEFLRLLKEITPELKLFIYPESFEQGLAIADSLDLYGLTIDNARISETQMQLAHGHNRRVTVWGIQTENENIEAIRKSPDYIQSDKIIHLLKIFEGYKRQGWRNLEW